MKKNDLKKRWEIFNHSDEIFRKTEGFKKSPFGLTTQGLVDFRGISLSSTPFVMGGGWENSTHETDIFDVDFSGGSWTGFDLKEGTLRNCLFVDVKFIGDIRLDGVSIEECTFDGCSFKNINFTKSIFKNVDFKKINARDDFSFNVKKINNCSFEGEMTGIRFGSSPISQTSFSGMLNDCSFFGHDQIEVVDLQKEIYKKIEPHEVANRMDLVDFSNASLVRCQFGNYCYLDKVIPPPIEENCISELTGYFYEKIKDLVRKELPIDLSKKALMWLETFYKPDVRVPYGVIGPHDFKKSLGEVGALDFYKIFTLAAIECKTKV